MLTYDLTMVAQHSLWRVVYPRIFRLLVDYGANLEDRDSYGNTILLIVCADDYEFEDTVRMLLNLGADNFEQLLPYTTNSNRIRGRYPCTQQARALSAFHGD